MSKFLSDHGAEVAGLVAAVILLAGAVLTYLAARRSTSQTPTLLPPSIALEKQSTLDRVLEQKVLRVGCIVADPWFIFPEEGSRPSGIYPAILDDIGERNNLNVIYGPIRNTVVFEQLDAGHIDVVAQLLQTSERARRALFAAYIHNVNMVAIVRKGQIKISKPEDLGSKSVKGAVVKGEIGQEIAREHYGMTEENDRLMVLDTGNVVSVFYLVHDDVDVAITTGARWIQLRKRDPRVAAKLEHAFASPLLVVPAGSLIRSGEDDFKVWLERETAISRANPQIRSAEDKYLAQFTDAVVRI